MMAVVRPNKKREFAAKLMEFLLDIESDDSDDLNISVPFSKGFLNILEGGDTDLLLYSDEKEVDSDA